MNKLENLENAISLLMDIELNYSDNINEDVKQARIMLEKFKMQLLEEKFKNELEKQYLVKELERTRELLSIEESKNFKK